MKLAISTDNNMVSAHFGRCQYYTIVEIEENKIISQLQVDTPPHQPGVLPKFLNEKGVNCVITGGMGPRAQNLFKEMNIEPVIGVTGNVDDVIQDFLNGRLKLGESQCTHDKDHHQNCKD